MTAMPGGGVSRATPGVAEVLAGTRQWHVEETDVLAGLRQIPDGMVQAVCTSGTI